jgi:uncharacterized protein (TIGR02679 family)
MVDAALHRALLAARDKREQRGASGDGTMVVPSLQPEEALALDSLLSPRRPVLPGRTLRIALSQFEAALRACDIEPRGAYERVGGRAVRDLPAERLAARERRVGFQSWLASHDVVRSRPGVAEWFDHAVRQGRVRPGMEPLVGQALRVLAALPSQAPLQRTVLAARMLDGDPHGLDIGTPLHGLTVALLAAAAGLDQGTSAREVWAACNVLVDPVSSNVAVLNLPPLSEGRVAQLARALQGTHAVLTYGHLSAAELRWPSGVPCFSCENPSVLIAAELALGPSCPPLVCTSGRPSDAVRLLFGCVGRAGVRIRHHGDFDEAGVQILRDLQDRYGAIPWRFELQSLREALRRLGNDPVGPDETTLEGAVRTLASVVPEESLIDELLADLRAVGSPSG